MGKVTVMGDADGGWELLAFHVFATLDWKCLGVWNLWSGKGEGGKAEWWRGKIYPLTVLGCG